MLTKKGKKISVGWNKCVFYSGKNPHFNYLNGAKMTIHAEEMALKNTDPRKLNGASLYIVRSGNECELLNSHPCQRCMAIIDLCIKKHGLKTIYYSA